ncbi:MAG: thioredoxin [Patescibacteria group bacterium]|uniref:Thioredoxin n=1 Tax=candidate division WWE3 bacterium TaxID=2053526 RepID=A0A955J2C8_UNCKA|nr:thioredoxin [candidate division WWE3 bacterium]
MVTLVDYYADWCGPCKAMAPIFAEVEKQYEGKVEFKKVNVEEDSASAQKMGVMSIPTFIIFKDGNEVTRKLGAMPKETLTAWIDSNL